MPGPYVIDQPKLRVDDLLSRLRFDFLVCTVGSQQPGFYIIPEVDLQDL
jgi:hypothetical protein